MEALFLHVLGLFFGHEATMDQVAHLGFVSGDSWLLNLFHWLQGQSILETIGVVTGMLCVYLAAKNKILSWPMAIISVAIYMVIFWEAKLYADMGLQLYFMITNVYGWYFWSQKSTAVSRVKVSYMTKREVQLSVGAIVLFTVLLGTLLKHETDASFPFTDSFCTACSLVAQFFLARKVIQNWLIWMFVDGIYVVVYTYKGLDLTAMMYALYIYIAFVGYMDWRKEYDFHNDQLEDHTPVN